MSPVWISSSAPEWQPPAGIAAAVDAGFEAPAVTGPPEREQPLTGLAADLDLDAIDEALAGMGLTWEKSL
jgi:hypothetical protein